MLRKWHRKEIYFSMESRTKRSMSTNLSLSPRWKQTMMRIYGSRDNQNIDVMVYQVYKNENQCLDPLTAVLYRIFVL